MGLRNAQGTLLASVTVDNAGTRVPSAQGTAVWYLTELDEPVLTKGGYRVAGTMQTDATGAQNEKAPEGAFFLAAVMAYT